MKRIITLVLAVLMVTGLLAGCGGGGNTPTEPGGTAEPQYGGSLTFVCDASPNSLDPAKSTGVFKYMYTNLVYEAPLTRDAEGNIRPSVCDFELSEDGLTLKLWVLEGKKFHDGTDVEIEDVVASLQRTVHNSPNKYVKPFIKSIDVKDGIATVTFTEYSEKAMYYIACVHPFLGVMPKEICEEYTRESGKIIMDVADAIGTGPYKFSDWRAEESVTVVRFDGYKANENDYTGAAAPKKAYLDSITLLYNGDYSSAALTLLGGDADLAENISHDYRDQATASGIKYNALNYTAGLAITFNTKGSNPSSVNADLRKAIMAAIDVPEFVEFLHHGAYSVGGGPILSKDYYNAEFDNADYMGADNLATVQKYLTAAGYNNEQISFVCPSTTPEWATMIESYLKKAGINVKVSTMEMEAYEEHIASAANDWDFFMGYPSLNDTPVLLNDNVMQTYYLSAEKDALLSTLKTQIAGSDEYMATWNELASQMVDDCAIVILGQSKLEWFMNSDLYFDYDGRLPFLWNAYWGNPEAHK